MKLKEKFGATITHEDLSQQITELRELHPRFRGVSTNKMMNMAWIEFVIKHLYDEKADNEESQPLANNLYNLDNQEISVGEMAE